MTQFSNGTVHGAMDSVQRMRSVRQCYEYLKELDAGTIVSMRFNRKCCADNKIQNFKSGTRLYVSLDGLIALLHLNNANKPTPKSKYF